METKLWIGLMAVSSLVSLSSQLDLSSIMGMGLGGKTVSTTPKPHQINQMDYNQNQNNYNNKSKPNKLNKFPDFNIKPDKQFKDNKFLDKQDKLSDKLNEHQDKFKQIPQKNNYAQQQGYDQNNQYYSAISNARPVESPIYSYSSPHIDDGYISPPRHVYSAQNYMGTTGQTYSTHHNQSDPGFDLYRRMYGYKNGQNGYNGNTYGGQSHGPMRYLPPPPPHSNYGQYNGGYSPQNANPGSYGGNIPPQYGSNSPVPYGGHGQSHYGSYGGNGNAPAYGGEAPIYGEAPPGHSYHNEDSYSISAYPHLDYSKYVEPIPYHELSEYISPDQYNNYAGMLYGQYNLPYAGQTPSNYSAHDRTYSEFRMVVAVAVIEGRLGTGGKDKFDYGGKDQFDHGGKDQFDHGGKDKFNKYGTGNIQGTLFISEIYPQICLVSGVLTGLPPNYKYGLAIYTYGDLTTGCESIGPHYNPENTVHGNINYPRSHVGDLGNIRTDGAGVAFVNKISRKRFSIQDRNPISGRAIGICDTQDDLGQGGTIASLQSGTCSSIQACGNIGYANTAVTPTSHYKK